MHRMVIGVDNGVTGSIGFLSADSGVASFIHTPVRSELSYTKTKKHISRIDFQALQEIFHCQYELFCGSIFAAVERPMINPGRFTATVSATRALEATLIALEQAKIPYVYCDSKEWQRHLLPKGLEKEELKFASLSIGKRRFPSVDFKGFKDADGLLIALWWHDVHNR